MSELVVSHVYSRSNLGDGLLADLTIDLLREVTSTTPVVVALDPQGFEASPALTYGGRARSARGALRVVGSTLHVGHEEASDVFRASKLVVATGGAYLRATTAREALTFAATHLTQLVLATEPGRRAVYLPQSIFPLRGPLSTVVRSRLARVERVYVRDDRSSSQLCLGNATRMPDLAVLEIARSRYEQRAPRATGDRILVQLRDLRRQGWLRTAQQFVDELDDVEIVVQSDAGRANSDQTFAARLGATSAERLDVALGRADHGFGAAVCGRLHAALACLMAGVPALHVAYERKSYGAFADLGLSNYLLHPNDLATGRARSLLDDLRADPTSYWAALEQQCGRLRQQRELLKQQLSTTARAAGLAVIR